MPNKKKHFEYKFEILEIDQDNSRLVIKYIPKGNYKPQNVNVTTPFELLRKGKGQELRRFIIDAAPKHLWESEDEISKGDVITDIDELVSEIQGNDVSLYELEQIDAEQIQEVMI